MGAQASPPHAYRQPSVSGTIWHPADTCYDGRMRCSALAAHCTLRQDILKRIWRRAVPPPLNHPSADSQASLPGLAPLPTVGLSARGDILMALPQGISIADISVIHLFSLNIISWAATTAGAAASLRDQLKRTAYARVEPHGCGFVPFSVETYGRLSQPAMKLLHLLGEEAAGPVGATWASFVNGALQELSVGLCVSGMRVPTDEYVE
jgi:hypothetical protein